MFFVCVGASIARPPAAVGGRSPTSVIKSVPKSRFYDSFSLEGEAFGGRLHLLQKNEQRGIRDKASPLGEKLSSPGSSEPGLD